MAKRNVDWRKYRPEYVDCPYNKAIKCTDEEIADTFRCKRCGWNPAEAERRKEEIHDKLKAE